MKAAVYDRYGPPDVLRIEDVEKPVPRDNEVLVRIRATTVCAADWRMRKADPFLVRFMIGLWQPKKLHILGMEFAGEVESAGKAANRFAKNDRVFGSTGFKFGTHAEYVSVPEDGTLAIMPVNMIFEEAAAVLLGGTSACIPAESKHPSRTKSPHIRRFRERRNFRRSTGEVLRCARYGSVQHGQCGVGEVSRR